MYLFLKKKKKEKKLPVFLGATIRYFYYNPMMGGWLVMGQDIYNEEGQRYPFYVANQGMIIPYWYSHYLMVDGSWPISRQQNIKEEEDSTHSLKTNTHLLFKG